MEVFISYSRRDKAVVDRIIEALEGAGVAYWQDVKGLIGGNQFSTEIAEAIEKSLVVVLICSRESFASDFVLQEVSWARNDLKKPLIPLWIEPYTKPTTKFGLLLTGRHPIFVNEIDSHDWFDQLEVALRNSGVTVSRKVKPPTQIPRNEQSPGNVGECERSRLNETSGTKSETTVPSRPVRSGIPLTSIRTVQVARDEQARWLKQLGLSRDFVEIADKRYRLVPPGTFVMGAPRNDLDADPNERPQVRQEIAEPFFVMEFPVTAGDLRDFAESLLDQASWQKWDRDSESQDDNCPAVEVGLSLIDAYRECLRERTGLQTRLPTETEWEYFARAGSSDCFWWGSDFCGEHMVCRADRPSPADPRRANAWGLIDALGNVAEWTASGFGPLNSGMCRVAAPESGVDSFYRAVRGGNYWEVDPRQLRTTTRLRMAAGSATNYLGFRLVIDSSTVNSLHNLRSES